MSRICSASAAGVELGDVAFMTDKKIRALVSNMEQINE